MPRTLTFLSGMNPMISSRNCTLQQSSVNCRDQCVHREYHCKICRQGTLTLPDWETLRAVSFIAIGCATRATGRVAKIGVVKNTRCRPGQAQRAVWCMVYLCQTRPGVKAGRTTLLRCVKDRSIAVQRSKVSSQSRSATGLFALDLV